MLTSLRARALKHHFHEMIAIPDVPDAAFLLELKKRGFVECLTRFEPRSDALTLYALASLTFSIFHECLVVIIGCNNRPQSGLRPRSTCFIRFGHHSF